MVSLKEDVEMQCWSYRKSAHKVNSDGISTFKTLQVAASY